ncbi:hypothetical protein [Streptomyces sp. NPDC021622]|uniref:hypothetical protein n=1 Tax=Streptomyces sp. NPDC021622 TaxID=3155013 RepID=UPI0034091B71
MLQTLQQLTVALLDGQGYLVQQTGLVRVPEIRMRQFDLDVVAGVPHAVCHNTLG